MRVLQRATRKELNALPVAAPDLSENYHLYRCQACRQMVDRRSLGDVLTHEEPAHAPTREGLSFITPMMPTLVDAPPEGDEWQHEIKYDGYRTQLVIDGGQARAFTRNGYDWTGKYPGVVRAAEDLWCASAIIDGEVIIQDEQGRSDFGSFKSAMETRPEELVFMAFDLLSLNGGDLRSKPLIERRQSLQELLGTNDPSCCIHFSDHVVGSGADLFLAADQMGLEGIVSKRITSRYRSGPTKSWLKVKSFGEGEFIVIGTARGERAPTALLARETADGLEYAGSAMVTLPEPDRETFWRLNELLKVERSALPLVPRKETSWLRPAMRVRVKFLKGEEMLRHATVRAIVSAP